MNTPNLRSNTKRTSSWYKLCAMVLLGAAGAATLLAENPVYVTARPTPSGSGANPHRTYNDNAVRDDTSAKSTAPDAPPREQVRCFSTAFTNSSSPDLGITITPV